MARLSTAKGTSSADLPRISAKISGCAATHACAIFCLDISFVIISAILLYVHDSHSTFSSFSSQSLSPSSCLSSRSAFGNGVGGLSRFLALRFVLELSGLVGGTGASGLFLDGADVDGDFSVSFLVVCSSSLMRFLSSVISLSF